jgi:hypothetical protein
MGERLVRGSHANGRYVWIATCLKNYSVLITKLILRRIIQESKSFRKSKIIN